MWDMARAGRNGVEGATWNKQVGKGGDMGGVESRIKFLPLILRMFAISP